jgi:hypothetical protein
MKIDTLPTMPITVFDLAKKLSLAPEAVILHAMDLGFDIPEDEMIPEDIAKRIEKLEIGDDVAQTEHAIEEQLEREIVEKQQEQTAGSKKKIQKKQAEKKKEELDKRDKVEIKTATDGSIILPEEMTVRELSIKIAKPIRNTTKPIFLMLFISSTVPIFLFALCPCIVVVTFLVSLYHL